MLGHVGQIVLVSPSQIVIQKAIGFGVGRQDNPKAMAATLEARPIWSHSLVGTEMGAANSLTSRAGQNIRCQRRTQLTHLFLHGLGVEDLPFIAGQIWSTGRGKCPVFQFLAVE